MKKLFFSAFFISMVLLNACKENERKLPYLGTHSIVKNDTQYYKIPDFRFQDQNERAFGSDELKSKPYIAYFFFTSCPSICPRMSLSAKRIQLALKDYKNNYNMVSFTVDPERDNFNKLREYAEEYNADTINWHFIRGSEDEITELGIKGFFVGISKDKLAPGGFLHTEKMILVDGSGHPRGYYSGTDNYEIKKLIGDMQMLIRQKL